MRIGVVVSCVSLVLAVTASAQQLRKIEPSLSADGKRFVYVQQQGQTRELWVSNIDGTGLEYLLDADGARMPRFSPDGKQIAFLRDDDVWTIGANGQGLRRVTKTPAAESAADFTPTGQELVFVRDGAGIVLNLATGEEVPFLPKELKVSRLYPVSEHQVHVSCSCEATRPDFHLKPALRRDAFEMTPDGGAVSLGSRAEAGPFDHVVRLRSARKGQRHVFDMARRDVSGSELREVVIVDGANRVSLAGWIVLDFDIAADGSRVILSGRRGDNAPQKLHVYDLTTKQWSEPGAGS